MSETYEKQNREDVRKVSNFVFWEHARIYIMALSTLCLTLTQMNSLTFNFTVICMDDIVEEHHLNNETDPHWMEQASKRSLLFSGAAIGGIIGLVPSVPMIHHLGVRNVLTLSGFISATGCFFFPIAASFNFYFVLLCRILQGLGISVLFTVMGVIPGSWAPNSEASTYLAILSCCLQFSNIICMPVSGILCESSLGWKSIYYIFGIVTFLVYILFYLTYTDLPRLHRNVSHKELGKINEGKVSKGKEPVPYIAMSSDLCVIAAWVATFGGNLGFFALSLYGPTYLKEVLHFDIRATGFISALPFVLSAILKFVAGQLSDKMYCISEKSRFVIFYLSSQIGISIGFLVMSFSMNRTIAQFAYIFSIVASGLNVVGTYKCVQLRCRQHVHFAIAVIAFTAYFVQLITPIGTAFLCPDNTPEQWRRFFLILAGSVILISIPFPFFTTSETASYVNSAVNETKVPYSEA